MPILLYTQFQIQPILHLRDLVKGLVLFSLIILIVMDQSQEYGDRHQDHR